ncbi:MAG: MBL fold metallo-hydrolase [Candidatus Levybacteria bacterium]|nr:MBL fold metallo-hydrolase [Candidatus Levybacteria bacterium]
MKKFFLIGSLLLFLLGCILIYQNITYNDKKLHVVICNVGQGDAIFIRTPQGSDILIDGGPDDSVLNCLGKHMPFWDRTLEIIILTHPDADHVTGLIDVIERYKLIFFYTSKITTKTAVYNQFLKTLEKYKIKQNYLWQGDRFILKDGLSFQALWPAHEWEEETVIAGGATNSFSVIGLLTYKKFKALFTGDSDAEQMEEVEDFTGKINFLKVPHHGSRFGLTAEILDVLNPRLAVISVGKNSYGHPTQFILDLLKSKNIKTLRTDQVSDIEIVSDGKSWKVN